MAGTMAFYNGMEPGITKMVSSFAGDAASQRGYTQAANAEHDIASARKANVEAQIKANEYRDTTDNALGYAAGQHGVSGSDLQTYIRNRAGRLNQGEQAREYSPEEAAKYNPAMRDYAAMRTGKFHDVSQGATEFAQLPAVQNSVRAASDYGKTPGVSAADIIRMNQASVGKNVLSAEDSSPTSVREANWLLHASPQEKASWMERAAATRAPGTTINMPNATQYGVNPANGKPGMFQIGRNGESIFTPIDPIPKQESPMDALTREAIEKRKRGGGAVPAVPAQGGRNSGGAIVPLGAAKPTTSGW